ncbi:uncharacterized protein LOC133153277 isoform X3 [Syngnathus typhle]|uniref:uncharacterized protein LOC133153277 isoform X3 n=1 Tax=Syngnathus typhle TaxID=161592 RepID=UPI002A6ADCEE|nr:uncharacterized protein LOC133153277 isoform X3 [Syngnathus typhle]
MCAKTVKEECEEELFWTKGKEPQRKLLDGVFNEPQDVLHRAELSEQQEPEPPNCKEENEPEPLHIKEEELETDITKLPLTGIFLKREDEEDDGQSEVMGGAEPPSSSSSQHATTEGVGDHSEGSQVDSRLAPLSDSDDISSPSPETDDGCSKGHH